MTQKNDNGQSFIEQVLPVVILSFIIFLYIGVIMYMILMNGFGLNHGFAVSVAIGICAYIAYKILENKKDITDDKNSQKIDSRIDDSKSSNSTKFGQKKDACKDGKETITEDKNNQKELDRYVSANHSKEDIGLFYERYIGYIFESKGWHVIYHGAKKGKEDEGIDLICIKNDRVRLVQCKYWSQNKTLFENSIFQLYGTWQFRVKRKDFAPKRLDAYLITSTVLSEFAKNSAETLDINIKQNFKLNKNYPKIKCTTTKDGEKIYHLPTDQQYDNIGINKDSRRFYVRTVADAVAKGHRRAYRHAFNKV